MEESGFRKCFLCVGNFIDPRILPCGHTFCLECLVKLLEEQSRNKTLSCPKCFASIDIPEGGLNALKKNAFYDLLGTFMDTTKMCDICPSKTAEKMCVECGQCYCSSCSDIHKKMNSSKNHIITDLKSSFAVFPEGDRSSYEVNSKKVDVYCEDCNQAVSLENFAASHQGHKMKLMSELLKIKHTKLNDLITFKTSKTTEIATKQGEIKNILTQANASAQNVKQQILNRVEQLISEIQTHSNTLTAQVDTHVSNFKQIVNQVEENLINLKSVYESEIGRCNDLVTRLSLNSVVETQLDETPDVREIPTLAATFSVNFTPTDNSQVLVLPNVVGNIQAI